MLPALVGVAAMLLVTRHGAYLSPDALSYVGTARSLVDGHGYTPPPGSPPIGNFPPLYPLVLAAVGAFGPDPLTAARFVNPIAFGLTIVAVGFLARRMTGSLPLAVVAQLLVLGGVDFLMYHSAALSEPLFLLFGLLALAALARPKPRPLLVALAALLAAAACLTRYLGLAVIVAGILALAARRKWTAAAAFGVLALAPLAGWLAWVRGAEGRTTNRSAVLHGPTVDYFTRGARNASTWLFPQDLAWPWRGSLAAAVVTLIAVVAWRTRATAAGDRRPALVVAAFAAAYLAALVADRSLFDVTGRLDHRFLMPLHAAAIALAVWALRGVDLARSHVARLGLCALVGAQLVTGGLWVSDALGDPSARPGGFTAPAWSSSEAIDQVRALPATRPVYTNEVDALYFHTGRVAMPVPEKRALLTGEPNPAYDTQLAAMADGMRSGGLLVYFTAAPARTVFLPTPSELAGQLRLHQLIRDPVGVVYRMAPT